MYELLRGALVPEVQASLFGLVSYHGRVNRFFGHRRKERKRTRFFAVCLLHRQR